MNDEIKDLVELIKSLEGLREKHTITYEGLHEVTGVMADYAWATEKHHPLHMCESDSSGETPTEEQ